MAESIASFPHASRTSAAADVIRNRRVLDLSDPMDNVYAYAKMFARLDGRPAYGICDGVIYRVAPDERVQPILGYVGLCPWTAVDVGNGQFRISGRELCYYTDLATGEVLDSWYNPFNSEQTVPYHVRNRAMHTVLTRKMKRLKFGDHHETTDPLHPQLTPGSDDFILNWKGFSERELSMTLDIMLAYPNACDAARWAKESTGPMLYPSEHWTFFVSRDELEDLDRPYADYRMVYGRVSPWAPWMLMGRRPGWMYYQVTARKAYELADVPPKLLKYVETHDPEFLTIPEYREPLPPTLTSWESFARDRTPTP